MKAAYKGILATVISAIIFGITPILARIAYDGGANGISMTFLRAALSLPVLFLILKHRHIPIGLEQKYRKGILLVGTMGTSLTTLLLYMSYSYIPVGMATTMHFIYPTLVMIVCAVLFREKMGIYKICAFSLTVLGTFLFMDFSSGAGTRGMMLALFSGVSYAFYMAYSEKSELKHMYYFKLSFYLCIIMTVVSGVWGILTGTLSFNLTLKAWFFALVVSLLTSVGAVSCLQLGIQTVGASTAAILSTLEPITSIVLGILILKENLTPAKAAGSLCVILSILIVTRKK